MKKLLLCFAAGCLGALANSLAAWFFGDLGITTYFHVSMAPALSPAWLYPRIVWGGIWGLLFVIPVMNANPVSKGLFLSLFPTLIQLLVIFPLKARKGYLGFDLGTLTPVFVIFFNMVWGVVTSVTIKYSK